MKLKFERYPGMGCFYVRGQVEADKFKILLIGLDTLIKDQEEPIIIHLGHAQFTPQEIQILAGIKKKMLAAYKITQYWVCSDRAIGEFKTLELFCSRTLNTKTKYIGDRMLLDDEIFLLNEKITSVQNEIGALAGSDESVKKIILENDILKAQKEILDSSLSAQRSRMTQQALRPSDDPEIGNNIAAAHAELVKVAAQEVPL